jgi:tetraacyldisaccharide 4'-kinase
MEGDFIKINKWLLPLSCFYGIGVKFRNLLFEMGVLKSRSFNVPVISVGNITVGGTGKTPHTEYLGRLLRDYFNVAILSRGYKRKSKGFLVASAHTTMQEIGDEPYQMKQKFADITVAVDKDRCHGIEQLSEQNKQLDVVLLDDAFQHRYVKPGINILLVDYHRLIIYDKLLPAGRLREPIESKNRADIVIVTKCPKDLKPMEFRVITKAMSLYPYQQLFFSTHEFETLRPVFQNNQSTQTLSEALADQHVLLLTGIASPEQMLLDLKAYAKEVTPLAFSDHHNFKKKDIERINEAFSALPSPKLIITTEKDEARLKQVEGLSDEVKSHLYALPIKIQILLDQEKAFNQTIINYVRKNSRNGLLAKKPDDHKPKDSYSSGDRPRTISFRNN